LIKLVVAKSKGSVGRKRKHFKNETPHTAGVSEHKRMRRILTALIGLMSISCSTYKSVEVYADGSARVTQDYSYTHPYELQEKLGTYDTEKERKNYESPIISEFKDFYSSSFSFKIQNIDSVQAYLSGLTDDFVKIKMFGDSLLIFETQKQSKKPEGGLSFYIDFKFDTDIVNVASSNKAQVYWKKKKTPRTVGIYFHPKPMWKKNRTHLVAIELK
jgi:hypothetical protein